VEPILPQLSPGLPRRQHYAEPATLKDTVNCTVTVTFGNRFRNKGEFFPNHTAEVAFNFAAGNPPHGVTIPFSYTPTGREPAFDIKLTCTRTRLEDGSTVTGGVTEGFVPLGSFDIALEIDV
jgi:hypothetical protein